MKRLLGLTRRILRSSGLHEPADTRPKSAVFGWDRGTPIDRYYIERFLAEHQNDISGRVLEVGDDTYSRRFGDGRVAHQDILHLYRGDPRVSLVGDLSNPDTLPRNTFDCIVLTQTLHLVFDLDRAIEHIHCALKPGGVLLLTTPGITQIDRGEWGETWFWSFTSLSIGRLFGRWFDPDTLEIIAHGNVFAASAFLYGLACEEVDKRKLNVFDPAYPVIITLRARRNDKPHSTD